MESYYLGNGKRWVFSQIPSGKLIADDPDNDIPEILKILLEQRDIKSMEDAVTFLNPALESLYDPFLLEGMQTAAERIIRAMEINEKILIYGDYDVDGVSATSILVSFFRSNNSRIDFYIPDRVDEGYGISDAAVEFISENEYDLVITVDCGITSRFQVDAIYERYAQKGRMIDIIITDHHQYNSKLIPEALVILNPHIPSCRYPYKNLCGAGIALKLVQAVGIKLNIPDAYKEYLDMAALATIADVVELQGENRIITKYGIKKIADKPCLGLKALIKASASQPDQMDSYRISFTLAPRVNAAGRMGDASRAVKLFTTTDENEAERIALMLNQVNNSRQEVQDDIFKAAVQIIENDINYQKEKILVVYGEGWHHGVIGIVASKLVDRFHKPAFVISAEGDKAVGSGRSIEGFSLFSALEAQSDLLTKFGGHEQAGGISLMSQDIEFFRKRINAYAEDLISEEMLLPATSIHLDVSGDCLSLETVKLISRLEPFGSGNQTPVFCSKGAILVSKKTVGSGKHLKLTLSIGGKNTDGIYFNKGSLESGLFVGDKVDVIFTQEINNWQNRESIQIRIWDLRLDELSLRRNHFLLEAARKVECLDCDENWLYNGIIDKIIGYDDIVVNRDILTIIYRYITRIKAETLSLADLFIHSRILGNETKKNMNCFKFLVTLLIFDELELIGLKLETDGRYRINRSDESKKVDLEDSSILQWLNETVDNMEYSGEKL